MNIKMKKNIIFISFDGILTTKLCTKKGILTMTRIKKMLINVIIQIKQ